MVYRARNAAWATAFLDRLPPGADVRLWALDRPAPALASLTVGEGPGDRFPLLNRALAAPRHPAAWVVLADDDVAVTRGSVAGLVDRCRGAAVDLAQPAHDRRSHVSHDLTRRRPALVAREVGYVEQGPLVVLSPRAQTRLLPLPEDVGMGWGIEYRWSAARRDGLRLAIVDAVAMRHLAPAATGYDIDAARAVGRRLRAEQGLTSVREIQRVTASWPVRRRRPPWARGPAVPGTEDARALG